jgi:hypothetical protein
MEIFKVIIAFLLGLIPFIIKLILDFRSEKEKQIERYRIIFFEKQLEVFSEITITITDLNNMLFQSTFGYGYEPGSNVEGFKPSVKVISEKIGLFKDLIKKYELFIPTELLFRLHEYRENAIFLMTPDITMESSNLRDKPTFTNQKELNDFFQENNKLFNRIILTFRAIVGVDIISKKIMSNLNSNKEEYSFVEQQYKL